MYPGYILLTLISFLVIIRGQAPLEEKKPQKEAMKSKPEKSTSAETDEESRQAAVHQYRSVCHGDGTCTYIFTLRVPSKMGMPLPADMDMESMTGSIDPDSPKVAVLQQQLKTLHNTLYNLTTANHEEAMMLTDNINNIQTDVKHIDKKVKDVDSNTKMLNDGYSTLRSDVGQIEAKVAAATKRAKAELRTYMKNLRVARLRMTRLEALLKGQIPEDELVLTIGQKAAQYSAALRHVVAVGSDCATLYKAGMNVSGVYTIKPDPSMNGSKFDVYCDMETDGGGWTVVQRREDGMERFDRNWADYRDGFGNLREEFWLGLEKMHLLSITGSDTIRFDLEDFEGKTASAVYQKFKLSDENDKYRIQVGKYKGTAGNAFHYRNHFLRHNNMQFSTEDNDNDKFGRSCPHMYRSGWWFHNCMIANLNGLYYEGGVYESHHRDGIMWKPWHQEDSLKKSEIKVRPSDFISA